MGLRAEGIGLRSFAIGLTQNSRRGTDFRIALRLPLERMLESRLVSDMTKEAAGEVDVRVIGPVHAMPARTPSPDFATIERHRPLRIGSSVGHGSVTAGTLGGFVSLEGLSRPAILSNNHVLAGVDAGIVGDAILQPGRYDGGAHPDDQVAALTRFVPLLNTATYDVAVAEVIDEKLWSSNDLPDGPLLAPASDPDDVDLVEKWGRTTGHTLGRVTAVEVDGLGVDFDGTVIQFNGVTEIEGRDGAAFSAGGDSGSVVYSSATREAFGLLFAGSEKGGSSNAGLTYLHPIREALDAVNGQWL
jgi:hypothetical protein